MYVSEIIERGALSIKKEGYSYIIEYTDYNSYGILKTMTFKDKKIIIAYKKLEEYLSL